MIKWRTVRRNGIAASAVGILAITGCSTLPPGPIDVPNDHGYSGVIVAPGQTFTDAFDGVFVNGDRPITITKLELVDSPRELELVGVYVAGEDRDVNFQFETTFPPVEHDTGKLVPAVGATLLPVSDQGRGLSGYLIVMAIKVTEPGKWVRGGYRLEYEIDGVRYGWDAVAEITVCTPDFLDENGECNWAEEGEE